MKEPENLLAFSPGTYAMGIVLFRGETLIDCKLRKFQGCWSQNKGMHIIKIIAKLLEKHQINKLLLKVPDPRVSSAPMQETISAIKKLCMAKEIVLHTYIITELEKHFENEGKINRNIIIKPLAEKYPDVTKYYIKVRRDSNSSYIKIFEALAAVEVYHKTYKIA